MMYRAREIVGAILALFGNSRLDLQYPEWIITSFDGVQRFVMIREYAHAQSFL